MNIKRFYIRIETYINKYPTKIRVYLSVVFTLAFLYNIKEALPQELYQVMIIGFVLAPLLIYWFTILVFKEKT
ncbi:MAG: hypothetical protein DRG78_03660 [Epsilonproteobacteria bacterium]|nr:MAG: hypothetical protein DRG78_03660 [Campylobacterota bacterium]